MKGGLRLCALVRVHKQLISSSLAEQHRAMEVVNAAVLFSISRVLDSNSVCNLFCEKYLGMGGKETFKNGLKQINGEVAR